MKRISHIFSFILSAAVLLAAVNFAQANNRRTWVAGTGADSGGCTVTAPCQTFQYAQSKTSVGGTINVLSPGDFGAITITQSLNIVADGVEALIAAINVSAVTINTPGVEVSLHGLTIDQFPGQNLFAINVGARAVLRLENVDIRGGLRGINFAPASGNSQLHILNSTITSTTSDGLAINLPGGPVTADIQGLRVRNTGNAGILIAGQVKAAIRDSVLTNNVVGIRVAGSAGSPTNVMMTRVHVENNSSIGVHAKGGTVRMGECVVTGNGTGLAITNGGTLATFKTNQVAGNGADGAPNATVLLK